MNTVGIVWPEYCLQHQLQVPRILESRDEEVRAVAFDAMRRFAPFSALEEVRVAMENERKPHPRAQGARAYIAVSQRKK